MCEELNQELERGRAAAEKVAEHMENMGAAHTEWLIPCPKGMYKVEVQLIGFCEESET